MVSILSRASFVLDECREERSDVLDAWCCARILQEVMVVEGTPFWRDPGAALDSRETAPIVSSSKTRTQATSPLPWSVTGDRNFDSSVHFSGD